MVSFLNFSMTERAIHVQNIPFLPKLLLVGMMSFARRHKKFYTLLGAGALLYVYLQCNTIQSNLLVVFSSTDFCFIWAFLHLKLHKCTKLRCIPEDLGLKSFFQWPDLCYIHCIITLTPDLLKTNPFIGTYWEMFKIELKNDVTNGNGQLGVVMCV